MTGRLRVSLIVAALNEADRIQATLRRLRRDFPDCELLVVDGGSTDGTAELARPVADVITSARGRGRQLDAGARRSTGDVLWFHHADTVTDPAAFGQLLAALADPRVVGGGLSLRFDRPSAGLAYLAWTSNLRARRLGWVFGDQAMFVRRTAFEVAGGFGELPIMEDLELSRRLRRLGRTVVLPATSTASARRFEAYGTWRMVAFMQVLKAMYLTGADPHMLERRYAAGPRSMLPLRRTPVTGSCTVAAGTVVTPPAITTERVPQ